MSTKPQSDAADPNNANHARDLSLLTPATPSKMSLLILAMLQSNAADPNDAYKVAM